MNKGGEMTRNNPYNKAAVNRVSESLVAIVWSGFLALHTDLNVNVMAPLKNTEE